MDTELLAWIADSCRRSGVPLRVADPTTIRKVAVLLMPRSKRERWGSQYGNTRGKPDIQLARRRSREETTRFQEAQSAVQRARDELERRMAYERANPTPGRVLGATYAAQQAELAREAERASQGVSAPRRPRRPLPAEDAQGNGEWTMGQARSMLRAGYHLFHVQRLTGWGAKAFDDMRVDPDGFGLPIE